MPGVTWFTVWKTGLPPLPAATFVVLSGALEGLILGAGQWWVLHRWNPAFSKHWIRNTAFGAMAAWAAGMLPSTASDLGAPALAAMALVLLSLPAILLAMPLLQAQVLGRYLPRARRWVWWSVAAWTIALPPTFIGPALLPPDASAPVMAATWVFAGCLMAFLLAVVTGTGMARIIRASESAATNPG